MSLAIAHGITEQVREWWRDYVARNPVDAVVLAQPTVATAAVRDLAEKLLADVPRPGSGATDARFEVLLALGEIDLNLGRLAEAHMDALAIIAELAPGHDVVPGSLWGVWAAELPQAAVTARETSDGSWHLDGCKAWCSGAGGSTHALVTARAEDGRRLFAVDLRQPSVSTVGDPWRSPALSGSDTRAVKLTAAAGTPVGGVDGYLDRPGFWHGAVGVAAAWCGGAVAIGRRLLDTGRQRDLAEVDLANLGAVDAALTAARSTLMQAARAIDADPVDRSGTAAVRARSVRAVVETSAQTVIERAGRTIGPGPLAVDEAYWRRIADLSLYLRQSHGDRDLADLGRRLIAAVPSW